MSCPICGQNDFYFKDPEDEYECYDFTVQNGEIRLGDTDAREHLSDITEETEAFCNRCSWHDQLKTIQKSNAKEK